MKISLLFIIFISTVYFLFAGDGLDGPNRYEADFSDSFAKYQMTSNDLKWSASLLRNLKESGRAFHFVRTDLFVAKDSKDIRGAIYQCMELPQFYYISDGDVMFDLKKNFMYNPGCGGFSMHSPNSRNFIVCLNIKNGGVPILRHSEVRKGKVWWFSDQKYDRLKDD